MVLFFPRNSRGMLNTNCKKQSKYVRLFRDVAKDIVHFTVDLGHFTLYPPFRMTKTRFEQRHFFACYSIIVAIYIYLVSGRKSTSMLLPRNQKLSETTVRFPNSADNCRRSQIIYSWGNPSIFFWGGRSFFLLYFMALFFVLLIPIS